MNAEEFSGVLERQLDLVTHMLGRKADEYATDEDRLRNFKLAAGMQGTTPRIALGGMLAKHIVSIYDLISDPKLAGQHIWDEKITDAVNYLILLRAMVTEEHEAKGIPNA